MGEDYSPVLFALVEALNDQDTPTLTATTGSVTIDADEFVGWTGAEFLGRSVSSGNLIWVNTLQAEYVGET
jgi:hypothetical protein